MMERKILKARLTAARNRLEELTLKSSRLPAEQNSGVVKILEELEMILQDLHRASDELFLREDSV
jgi:hypothetical protein